MAHVVISISDGLGYPTRAGVQADTPIEAFARALNAATRAHGLTRDERSALVGLLGELLTVENALSAPGSDQDEPGSLSGASRRPGRTGYGTSESAREASRQSSAGAGHPTAHDTSPGGVPLAAALEGWVPPWRRHGRRLEAPRWHDQASRLSCEVVELPDSPVESWGSGEF